MSEEELWIRKLLGLPADATTGRVQGELHVWDYRQHGFNAYVLAYKCNDKQGEIARLSAEVKRLEYELQEQKELYYANHG